MFDHAPIQNASDSIGYEKNVTTPVNKAIAREISQESAVLLKNDNKTLPLNFDQIKNILIHGQDDLANGPITGGQGSGRVDASFQKTPLNELADRLGIDNFERHDDAQRHCNKDHCIIYHGASCHNVECIPQEWEWDVSISFVGINSGEGGDRNIDFPDEVNNLIHDLSMVNKQKGAKTVVVISTPGAAIMEWSDNVDAQI